MRPSSERCRSTRCGRSRLEHLHRRNCRLSASRTWRVLHLNIDSKIPDFTDRSLQKTSYPTLRNFHERAFEQSIVKSADLRVDVLGEERAKVRDALKPTSFAGGDVLIWEPNAAC